MIDLDALQRVAQAEAAGNDTDATVAWVNEVTPEVVLGLIARLRAAEAELVKIDRRHIVTFSRTGYGLQHPLPCRPNLLGCPVHKALARRRSIDRPPGKYVVTLVDKHLVYVAYGETPT